MEAYLIVCLLFVSQSLATTLQSSIDRFTVKLFEQSKNEFDTILSPFSVHDDLTMAALGARGKTFNELKNTLGLTNNRNTIASDYKSLLTRFQANNSVLKVANGIYVMKGIQIQTNYKSLIEKDFYTNLTFVDFNTPQLAAAKINDDVKAATHDLIKNIISPGAITPDTRLVLVNSVYFHGKWLNKFKQQETELKPFYTAPGASGDIRTMQQTNFIQLGFIPSLAATLISLPYEDKCFSFNILFPSKIKGLAEMETKLKHYRLNGLRHYLRGTYVQLDLPAFTTESSFSLNEPLSKLGIVTAFTNKADFGLFAYNEPNLSISSVAHKAYIKVDEDGTEAAAATSIIAGITAVVEKPKPVVVRVNHPFLYYISDCNNNIIFVGHFYGKSQ